MFLYAIWLAYVVITWASFFVHIYNRYLIKYYSAYVYNVQDIISPTAKVTIFCDIHKDFFVFNILFFVEEISNVKSDFFLAYIIYSLYLCHC